MKNRIISLILALALVASVIPAVIVSASDAATKPEIISNNIEYNDKFSLMYAVDAATVAEGAVTLNVYTTATAAGDPIASYTAAAPQTEKIDGADKSVYVFTTAGIAAKDLGDFFYAQAVDAKGNKSDVVAYSVVEYLLERLWGGYELTATQIDLYNTALAFGAAAQKQFSAEDAVKIGDYSYLRVVDGTVNGAEKGMFVNGTAVTLSANAKGWQATFADGTTKKIDGTTYTVEASALIETYNRPLDLTTSYYTTQKAAGETVTTYTSWKYWNYCTHNTGSSSWLKYLTNSSAAGDTVETHTHGLIHNFEDGNAAFKIGKAPAAGNASVAQTQFVNVNSADKNCFVFESDIMFDITTGAAVEATNVDKNNNLYVSRITVLANPTNDRNFSLYNGMMPKNSDGNHQYFEIYGEYDFETTTWKNLKIADQTFENGKWYKMVVEYYKAEGVMKLYFDGYLVSTVEGLTKDFVPNVGLIQLQGLAYGSSIYVDNTYVGTVDKHLAK